MAVLIKQEPWEGSCDLPRRLPWAKPSGVNANRLRLAVLFLGSLLTGSCFSPNQPVCGFSCAEAGACPDGYTCGADKFCHKIGATGVCPLDDAGMSMPDAATQD